MLAAPVLPNIGPQQRAFRRKLGIVFALGTLAAGAAIYFVKWSPFVMAVLIGPAFLSALCLLQAARGT